jgi:hypothetical protein
MADPTNRTARCSALSLCIRRVTLQVRTERDGDMELTLDLLLLKEKVTQFIGVETSRDER